MLIGLHGPAQAGKDTLCERLALASPLPVRRVSFADKLYASAAASIGVGPDVLRQMKTMPGSILTLEGIFPEGHELAGERFVQSQMNVRGYLQLCGTEGHRSVFGDDFWVEQADYKDSPDELVVVTDVRFDNERYALSAYGGSIVRVVGPEDVETIEDNHPSAQLWSEEDCDFVVYNDVRGDNYTALDSAASHLLRMLGL